MAEVLVVHDESEYRRWLIEYIRRAGFTALAVADIRHARTSVESAAFDVFLVCQRPGERLKSSVAYVREEWPTGEIIVIGDEQTSDDPVREGAFDYVTTSAVTARLAHVLRDAIEASHHRPGGLERAVDLEEVLPLDPVTRAIWDRADRIASVDSTLLITGESGTGKEVLARRVHRSSKRSRMKFVPVNCGSLPESLIETELFGYRKGAFTGALNSTTGLIEEAQGGTLFLDEIGDMPLAMQVKLLRFLDRGEIRAVGSTAVKHVDVRVIAATNRPLLSDVKEKRFRQDLFFRLNVVTLHIPALTERKRDIPRLVSHHLKRLSRKLGVTEPKVSDEAMSLMVGYHWPGNIRELQNALESALVQCSNGRVELQDLPSMLSCDCETARASSQIAGNEEEQLRAVLQRHEGSVSRTASALGISRTTLWRRLRQRSRLLEAGRHAAMPLADC